MRWRVAGFSSWMIAVLASVCLCADSPAAAPATAAPPPVVLRGISLERTGSTLEVRISADGPIDCRSFMLEGPSRFVLDLHDVAMGKVAGRIAPDDPDVRRIRVSQFKSRPRRVTRVVFDLASAVSPAIERSAGSVLVRFGPAVTARPVVVPPDVAAAAPSEPPQATVAAAPQARAPVMTSSAPSAEKPSRPRRRHVIYDLSYTQADRAVAILKALGYATVEFKTSAGDSPYDQLYTPILDQGARLPLVIKLIDAPKTSLMDRDPAAQPLTPAQIQAAQSGGSRGRQAVPDIGGTYLHQTTAGEPQERLLIVYDAEDPEPMERIMEILNEEIDIPARQVVISALVLELNTDRARELGLSFTAGNGKNTTSFEESASGSMPFTWLFDKGALRTPFVFSTKLRALIQSGEANVLSNPSVLVLDGRQARIQVGQQVPVVNSTSTAAGITSSVEYFPVGIVLNLRPRISEDGSEVTMQVETIVSAVAQSSAPSSSVFFAPTVDNRQVQTFVRVADNTPFIIGGLISSDEKVRRSGLPGLSQLPFVGSLFGTRTATRNKREVIVVLTPHVVPVDDKSFSYVIAKDSERFDSFSNALFRNAYRIRSSDLYDLKFVRESPVLQGAVRRIQERAATDPSLKRTEPFAGLLRGNVPGEEILVHRMLWEIVRKSGFGQKIDPKQILLFQPSATDPLSTDFEAAFLDAKLAQMGPGQNAMIIAFDALPVGTAEHPFVQPKAEITLTNIAAAEYERKLIEANRRKPDGTPQKWSIILSPDYIGSTPPLEILRNVLVLKRVLALNASMPMTIHDFSVGRQIMFPSEDDVARSVHVVDRDAARLFFEVKEYYRAFEQEFNATMKAIGAQLK